VSPTVTLPYAREFPDSWHPILRSLKGAARIPARKPPPWTAMPVGDHGARISNQRHLTVRRNSQNGRQAGRRAVKLLRRINGNPRRKARLTLRHVRGNSGSQRAPHWTGSVSKTVVCPDIQKWRWGRRHTRNQSGPNASPLMRRDFGYQVGAI